MKKTRRGLFLYGLIRLTALAVALVLAVYNLRRILFSLTMLFSPGPAKQDDTGSTTWYLPDVLILVPCRDEEKMVPGLCESLAGLDYPPEKRRIVLIDDGSQDQTRAAFEAYSRGKAGWSVLSTPENLGKARALNAAIEKISFGEIIYIYDADHRPQPDSLLRAMRYFQDPRVAGVSGRTIPSNTLASPTAYYSTVESYVHQMITMRAKDRLDLAPALLGSNCGYRRAHLAACGGFRNGALLEDSDLTLAFYQSGYRIRFAEDAVAYHQVPVTVEGYLKQHMRWGRGFNDVSKNYSTRLWKNVSLPGPLQVELFLFSTGYLDRIALMGAAGLSVLSAIFQPLFYFPRSVLYFALATPFIQILALFFEQRLPIAMWQRLPWIPIFFVLDIYAAVRSSLDTLLNRPRVWSRTERA